MTAAPSAQPKEKRVFQHFVSELHLEAPLLWLMRSAEARSVFMVTWGCVAGPASTLAGEDQGQESLEAEDLPLDSTALS